MKNGFQKTQQDIQFLLILYFEQIAAPPTEASER